MLARLKTRLSSLYKGLPIIRELRGAISVLLRFERLRLELEAIRVRDFHIPQTPRYADPLRLLRYEFQVSSQGGEDGIIREIFHRIGTTNKIFAEVGAGDGRENNTGFLLTQGWTGFWIDGSSDFLRVLEKRDDLPESVLKRLVSNVTRENVEGLFQQLGVPKQFDLLSVDIDQNTYYAWEGLANFQPRVVVVEYNAAVPPDVDWKVHYHPNKLWDDSQNYSASLKALELLGRKFGYSLVGCNFHGSNAFFVREELAKGKFLEPFTAENHYEPARFALLSRPGGRPAILDRVPNG